MVKFHSGHFRNCSGNFRHFSGYFRNCFFLPKNVKTTKIHNQQLLLTTECNFFQVNMSYIGTIALEADLIQPNWKGSMFSILVEYELTHSSSSKACIHPSLLQAMSFPCSMAVAGSSREEGQLPARSGVQWKGYIYIKAIIILPPVSLETCWHSR